MTDPGQSVTFTVSTLETAGLVDLLLEGPTGMKVAALLDPAEAQDLGERLVNAAIEVASA